MSNNEPLYVNCGPHGKRVAAGVCCHMIESSEITHGIVIGGFYWLNLYRQKHA